jgi:putative heme-binding domain-containing protein
VAFALDDSVEKNLRAEAMGSLLAWREPPRLDRVDGFARRLTTQPIEKLLSEKVQSLLELREPSLRQTAVEILIAYSLKAKSEQIYKIVVDSSSSGELRASALRLLSAESHGGEVWKNALEAALQEDSPPVLQQSGLEELMKEEPARALTYFERILKKAATAQKQHAIGLLATANHSQTDALLNQLGTSLLSGKLEGNIQWDVVSALTKRSQNNPSLAALIKQYEESTAGRENRELLAGGDKSRGSEIVINHLGANCMACHAMGDSGSAVGPNLRSIGLERDRRYLLESLLQPSAKLAPGYGLTMLSLKDGSQLAGAPLGETEELVSIKLPDGITKEVPKAEVLSKTPPVSVMPPMLGILNSGEIRDVVEFLSSQKFAPKADAKSGGH